MPVLTGFRLLAVLLVASGLVACAAQPAATPKAGLQVSADPAVDENTLTPFGFLTGVGLTTDQATRIRAIADRARPADDTTAQTRAAQFKALLTASTLDEAALADFFRQDYDQGDASRAKVVQMYADIRDVLTDTQRAEAAKALLAPPASPAPPSSNEQAEAAPPPEAQPSAPALNLTAEQKALFAASTETPPDPQAVARAIATVMTTGDTTDLKAALTPKRTRDETATAYVKAFASLTADQRKQLAQ